ncbi:MAG TPA: RNHCP domain-containing protein [Candidatus Paceibacterota bacterium]
MAFIRRIESFSCVNCGTPVIGDGYTNHCPKCLWSRHVDNDPGDRANICFGMMRPIRIEGSSPSYRIVHHCSSCGVERIVDAAKDDDPDALYAIIADVERAT